MIVVDLLPVYLELESYVANGAYYRLLAEPSMSTFSCRQMQEVLGQVITSRTFSRSEQLPRLLSFLVQATIAGRPDMLKETVIGIEFFGFSARFDPKRDPVVRMAMRRLRHHLHKYYSDEGARDQIVISLKPGSYVPHFVPKDHAQQGCIRIAVLPFYFREEEIGGALYAKMVTQFIRERLSANTSFQLLAHDGSPANASLSLDIEDLSRHFQVRFIVRGACSANPDVVRVCTELVDAEGRKTIWVGNHEQITAAESWTVQDRIAVDLERALFTASQDVNNDSFANSEDGASRLIVLGRHCLNQNNRESLAKSEAFFLAAIQRRPKSARAWAGLSVVQTSMALYFMTLPSKGRENARLSAARAINFDPSLPDGYTAAGLIEVMDTFRPLQGQSYFCLALELNPQDHSARLLNAMTCLTPLGRLQDAETELGTILASDPLSPKALQMLAVVLYFQRCYQASAEIAQSALDVLPSSAIASFTLANCYDRLGRESDALAQFQKCEELMPFLRLLKWPTILRAIYKGRTKWVRPSLLAAAKLLQMSTRAPSAMMADLLLRLGEEESAVKWMQRAFKDRGFRALYLAVDPAFDAIRSRPECEQMLRELQSRGSEKIMAVGNG